MTNNIADYSQSGEIAKLYPILADHPSKLVVDVGYLTAKFVIDNPLDKNGEYA